MYTVLFIFEDFESRSIADPVNYLFSTDLIQAVSALCLAGQTRDDEPFLLYGTGTTSGRQLSHSRRP